MAMLFHDGVFRFDDEPLNVSPTQEMADASVTPAVGASQVHAPTASLPPADRPPLASPHPNVSPVYEVKRQAAVSGAMTPAATADLYNTPTTVHYTQEPPLGEGVGGRYHWGGAALPLLGTGQGRMEIWRPGDWNTDETVRHEYLHKRYFEDMDPVDRVRWLLDYQRVEPETVERQMVESNVYDLGGWRERIPNTHNVRPSESYAWTGDDPTRLTPDERTLYYPGVYDEAELRRRAEQEERERRQRWAAGEGEGMGQAPVLERITYRSPLADGVLGPLTNPMRPLTEEQTALFYGTPQFNPQPYFGTGTGPSLRSTPYVEGLGYLGQG